MSQLLNKNIQALIANKNLTLAEKLKFFLKNNPSRFVKEGFNIYDSFNQNFIYTDEKEFEYFLNTIEEKTFKYPFICIYGVGNALMLKSLAKTHQCLFVFEKELELLALALSFVDLSDELRNKKLFFIDISDLKMQLYLAMLFNQNNIYEYLGLYEMFIQSSFYKNFYFEDMQKIDELCLKTIQQTLTSRGFYTPTLPLLVYEQFLQNIPHIIYNIPLKKLINERKNKFKNAAVISAGPSLNNSIELLKQYQNQVVIFCTDGAFSTLKKYGIKPDYVLNTDVGDLALNFFKDLKEKMSETIFVCGYPTHKSIIELLQKQNLIISLGSNDPACKMDILDDFGYLELGSNISHMCYALAVLLGFKNIFMLGQDFSLSKEGNSHTNDYALGEQKESKLECDYFEIESYGGGGNMVITHSTWNYYKQMLEYFISANLNLVDFYNTSQTGARINFTKELSFKECCEKFLKQQKPKFHIPKQNLKKQAHILNQFYDKLRRDNNECENLLQTAQNLYNALENILNSNKDLPLSFLENVNKSIMSFDCTLNKSQFFNDGKLSYVFIKRGASITAVLEQHIKDEKVFLIHFINAYKTWLQFFIQQSSLKHTIIQKALKNQNKKL